MEALQPPGVRLHGGPAHVFGHVLNFAVQGVDSEVLIVALKDLVAISNGSSRTSSSYTPSHVIRAMGYREDEATEALRSGCAGEGQRRLPQRLLGGRRKAKRPREPPAKSESLRLVSISG